MPTLNIRNSSVRGMGLIFVLLVLVAISMMASVGIRTVLNRSNEKKAEVNRSGMQFNADSDLEYVRRYLRIEFLDFCVTTETIESRCASTAAALTDVTEFRNKLAILQENLRNGQGYTGQLYSLTGIEYRPNLDVEIECVNNCVFSNLFRNFPKRFQITVRSINNDGTRVAARQTIEFARQNLRDFAQLVLDQRDSFTLAPGEYRGKIGIQWALQESSGGPNPPGPLPLPEGPVVKFNNSATVAETVFHRDILLSGFGLDKVGKEYPESPIYPRFLESSKIVADVPRTNANDLVDGVNVILQSPHLLGDTPAGGGGGSIPTFRLRQVQQSQIGYLGEDEGESTPQPTFLSQSSTLYLGAGDPCGIRMTRTVKYDCRNIPNCQSEITSTIVESRVLSGNEVIYANSDLLIRNESSSASRSHLCGPVTVVAQGNIDLRTSILKRPNSDATSALFALNGNVRIPSSFMRYDENNPGNTGTLLQYANQNAHVSNPYSINDVSIRLDTSLIVPNGVLEVTPDILALPPEQNAPFGGIQMLGVNVFKELNFINRRTNDGGTVTLRGATFKDAQWDDSNMDQALAFPGAQISAGAYDLYVVTQTTEELPTLAEATARLP